MTKGAPMKRISVYLSVFLLSVMGAAGYASAQETTSKAKSPTQEQLDEKELEALYGVTVERDRLDRNALSTATRDRYGDGRVAVFQDNTKSARNLETNDTIGVEFKLFEFK